MHTIIVEGNKNNIREKVLLRLISEYPYKHHLDGVCFFGFNSRLYFMKFLLAKLRHRRMIWDLGYPFFQNTRVSIIKKLIFTLTDIFMVVLSDVIFVESHEQANAWYLKWKKRIYVLYAADPELLDKAESGIYPKAKKGCIFNGDENPESGLVELYRLCNKQQIKLHVHSRNTSLESNSFITIDSNHKARDEFLAELARFKAQIGQFNSIHPRLQLTVPHKFFDSTALGQYYITYPYKPICNLMTEFNLKNIIFISSHDEFINQIKHLDNLPQLDGVFFAKQANATALKCALQ